jgi:hypothetical protein
MELDADKAKWKYMLKHGSDLSEIMHHADRRSKQMQDYRYFWALPLVQTRGIYKRSAQKVYNEHTSKLG